MWRGPLESRKQDASVLLNDHQCHSALASLDVLSFLVRPSDVGQIEVPDEELIVASDEFSLINILQVLTAGSIVLLECFHPLLHQSDASLITDLLQTWQLSAS